MDNPELLEQRAAKHRDKLAETQTVLVMSQERLDRAVAACQESTRSRKALASSLKRTRKKSKQLKKLAKQAGAVSAALRDERQRAERKLAKHTKQLKAREVKLAKAESALAAARAHDELQTPTSSSSRPWACSSLPP